MLRTPERGAELSLPTADLFGCALIRTPEQIRWSEVSTDYKSALQPAAWARWDFAQLRVRRDGIAGRNQNNKRRKDNEKKLKD